jgi:hypothetical protein
VNFILTMPEVHFAEMLAKSAERQLRFRAQGMQSTDASLDDDENTDKQQQQQQMQRRGRPAGSSSSSRVNGLNGSAPGGSILQATAAEALAGISSSISSSSSSRGRRAKASRADAATPADDGEEGSVEGVLDADNAWRKSLAGVFQQTSEELRKAVVGAGSAAAAAAAIAGRARRQQ